VSPPGLVTRFHVTPGVQRDGDGDNDRPRAEHHSLHRCVPQSPHPNDPSFDSPLHLHVGVLRIGAHVLAPRPPPTLMLPTPSSWHITLSFQPPFPSGPQSILFHHLHLPRSWRVCFSVSSLHRIRSAWVAWNRPLRCSNEGGLYSGPKCVVFARQLTGPSAPTYYWQTG